MVTCRIGYHEAISLSRFVREHGAPHSATLCYLSFASAQDAAGVVRLSYATIAAHVGLGKGAVGAALRHLRRIGLIQRTGRTIHPEPVEYRVVPVEEIEGREVGE